MIKDLVVNLAVTAARDAAAEFAISIAETFAAHVAGIAFAYEPAVAPTVVDGLSAAWIPRGGAYRTNAGGCVGR